MAITPSCAATWSPAHARAAPSTCCRLGQTSTDERNDLSGMGNRHFALQRAVVLERRTVRVPVRVPRGHVVVVEHPTLFDEVAGGNKNEATS